MRARRVAAVRVYKICSLLLSYPEDDVLAARPEIAAAIEGLPASPAREALLRFAEWWLARDPLALAEHYVETFDLGKRSGLYLTFYGEGDKRSRGSALLRLRRMYRAAGLPQDHGDELPDHLPVMLEFAALAPGGRGDLVLREHRTALELLRLSLRDHGTPYADVVEAACLTVGDASPAERAKVAALAAAGPPQELVGLEPFAPPEVMPEVRA